MKFFLTLPLIILLFIAGPVFPQKNIQLESPDGNILFSFSITEKAPVYQVAYKGSILIEDSELGLSFKEKGDFGPGLHSLGPLFTEVDEMYDLVVGKTKSVRNQYHEVIIPLVEGSEAKRQINLVVRVFNDGLAFRYEFPEQKNWSVYTLTEENSTFNLSGDPTVYTLLFENYTHSHEGPYHMLPLSQVEPGLLMDMPALFEFPGKTYMAITEAALRDYAGMYLVKHDGILRSQLSPLPGQNEAKVKASLPHRTPWRVMMISGRIGALIESNMLTSLNEPARMEDFSWIKPGKTTFHWWNGDVTPDTTFAPGINFETNKYYIDFCARNNIDYHAVIGYGGMAWYVHDGTDYSTARVDDGVIRQVPGLDMQLVCDYAKQKGVGIHVWVHWEAIYPKLEENFAQFEKWGISGMMVDFMDRDDQEMVNIQEEILASAAKHKLYIQFHGSFKPTGLSRTYPNEFTREGTLNYEVNKWRKEGLSPDHDIIMPFTRLLAGPTDYHLGGFRAVPESEFKTQYTRPLMVGTRCHMLAMYVVLESYLASLCDYPAAYEGQQGFGFLKEVPTTWDETLVPDAEVGNYITIARRKGTDWYIGSLNNGEPRTIKVPLDFLAPGDYTAEIYTDAPDVAQNPNHLIKQIQTVNRNDVLTLKLASGGGQVMRLVRQ
ncbi:glycoside hydrolase family 97 protein [Negadavirga shengliensis]|uniref:Glycoside hydrolase family 97 protein n=1 Tax=Negadavirga shengliensis TaxID=1389218 RepID=A0ABV9SW93_9BACT